VRAQSQKQADAQKTARGAKTNLMLQGNALNPNLINDAIAKVGVRAGSNFCSASP